MDVGGLAEGVLYYMMGWEDTNYVCASKLDGIGAMPGVGVYFIGDKVERYAP